MSCKVHFGNKLDSGIKNTPLLQLAKIKQTHSDIVVELKSLSDIESLKLTEADAIYTKLKNVALTILTADCLPILIYCPDIQYISAIHAGWRGVVNQICIKAASQLIKLGANTKLMEIHIGPHIQFKSFEVEKDVLDSLIKSSNNPYAESKNFFEQKTDNKFLVNLSKILIEQLKSIGCTENNIVCSNVDTVTDLEFHSFRRDKEKSGRNISYIVIN